MTRRIIGPANGIPYNNPPRRERSERQERRPAANPLVPSAPDAERALIGSLLLEGASALAVDECARMVDHTSFLNPAWSCAWRSIWQRAGSGDAIDPILVAEDCERDPEWPGGVQALSLLIGAADGATVIANAPWYARQVFAAAHRRRVIETAGRVAAEAYQHAGDPEELQASVSKVWSALDIVMAETETGDLGPVFDGMVALAESGMSAGWPTGIRVIDEWVGGVMPGYVWTIGGFSGLGKSWLACALANGLVDAGARVAFASLEMTAEQLMVRLLANRVGASSAYRLQPRPGRKPATWSEDEMRSLLAAAALIKRGIHVYTGVRTLDGIQSMARRGGYDVVIVDYGQLVEVPSVHDEVKANSLAARGLQALAKKANCAVIILSQVSNEHARLGKADMAHGYKGSGAWGEVADFGLMLRRDSDVPELLEISARKNRFGIDESAGAVARMRMDKQTGALQEVPTNPIPTIPDPRHKPAASWVDREPRDTGEVW